MDTRPLGVPAYRRIWMGQAVTHVGVGVTVVAVGQQVFELTHSSFYVGLIGIANLVPLVVFGLWGGAVADAVDRRKLLIVGSLIAWTATLFILAQAALGLDNIWVIFGAVALNSTGFAITGPTRGAIIPRILDPELVPHGPTRSTRSSTASARCWGRWSGRWRWPTASSRRRTRWMPCCSPRASTRPSNCPHCLR